MQGTGTIGKHALQTPAMIDFGELTEDEYFVSDEAARQGVRFQNTGTEPLVTLRYFGPEVNPDAPQVGDHKRRDHVFIVSRDRSSPRNSPMNHPNTYPKLHNAAWPGVVGKGSEGAEPFIGLDTMLDLTAKAEVDGVRFDGVDLFLFAPHVDIDSSDDDLKRLADKVRARVW